MSDSVARLRTALNLLQSPDETVTRELFIGERTGDGWTVGEIPVSARATDRFDEVLIAGLRERIPETEADPEIPSVPRLPDAPADEPVVHVEAAAVDLPDVVTPVVMGESVRKYPGSTAAAPAPDGAFRAMRVAGSQATVIGLQTPNAPLWVTDGPFTVADTGDGYAASADPVLVIPGGLDALFVDGDALVFDPEAVATAFDIDGVAGQSASLLDTDNEPSGSEPPSSASAGESANPTNLDEVIPESNTDEPEPLTSSGDEEISTHEPEKPIVLVVDDDKSVRDMFVAFLSDEYEVRSADSGAAALEQFDETVDAVLLDRRMPEISGDEVLKQLRERGADCGVCMVTAVDPETDIIDMAFDDYLTKPVDRDELLASVDSLLAVEDYDDIERELSSLQVQRNVLDVERAGGEPSEELRRLEARIDRLKSRIDTADGDA